MMQQELLGLGLLKRSDIRKQDPDKPALKRYFMHGIGHPLGLDVHYVALTTEPIQPGWVLTVERGIYLPEEGSPCAWKTTSSSRKAATWN